MTSDIKELIERLEIEKREFAELRMIQDYQACDETLRALRTLLERVERVEGVLRKARGFMQEELEALIDSVAVHRADGTPDLESIDAADAPLVDEFRTTLAEVDAALSPEPTEGECSDCPPVGYPTDKTRRTPCPRRLVEDRT